MLQIHLFHVLHILSLILCQSACLAVEKYLRQCKSKKDLFWLIISEVGLVGWLRCFGACVKAEHHGREHVVEQSSSPHGS
jgi:hypothetical protein